MLDILGKLFGSVAQVKLMRLFLLNQSTGFDTSMLKERTGIVGKTIGDEMRRLVAIGFVQKKVIKKEVLKRGAKKPILKRVDGYVFNQNFRYKDALANLIIDTEFIDLKEITERFKKAGKVKLLLLSGVFTKNEESRVDVLVVGDHLNPTVLERTLRLLESEIGKELTYAHFETQEFVYRASMYDKLIREVVDTDHIEVIDQNILSTVPKIAKKA